MGVRRVSKVLGNFPVDERDGTLHRVHYVHQPTRPRTCCGPSPLSPGRHNAVCQGSDVLSVFCTCAAPLSMADFVDAMFISSPLLGNLPSRFRLSDGDYTVESVHNIQQLSIGFVDVLRLLIFRRTRCLSSEMTMRSDWRRK